MAQIIQKNIIYSFAEELLTKLNFITIAVKV